MTQLSPVSISKLAYDAGFRGGPLVIAVAIAMRESRGVSDARHTNTDGSIDRGLWQINSKAHPDVSSACAFNPPCAARATHSIYLRSGFAPWAYHGVQPTGQDPSIAKWLPSARAAAGSVDPTVSSKGPGLGITDRIATHLPGVPGPIQSSADFFRAMGNVIGWLVNPHSWIRIVQIVGGFAAMIVGLNMLVKGEAPRIGGAP